jgi:ribonucleoside-diphosphate reductase alpha chain
MTRLALPNRRPSEVHCFACEGVTYHGGIGFEWATGRPMEVFLDAGKPGSPAAASARDAAVAVSLALQFGCPLETLRQALTRLDDGRAAGPLGTLLDLVMEDC